MKLELKHLAAYLPYEVNFISGMDKPYNEFGRQPQWTLDGITTLFGDCCLTTKENRDAYAIQTCNLILRQLSDLTKEITVNGETFVPINKLVKQELIGTHIFESMIIDRIKEKTMSFKISEKLFEWHFDVFGLIEAGLAIDINTLEK